jgi:Mycotoxin biosynthesis protein UstYa
MQLQHPTISRIVPLVSESYITNHIIKQRFHQLHCVAAIRSALQEAVEGKDIGRSWKDGGHWPHCLDYFVSVCTVEIILVSFSSNMQRLSHAMETIPSRDQ